MHLNKEQANKIMFNAANHEDQQTNFVVEAIPNQATIISCVRSQVILPKGGKPVLVHTHSEDQNKYQMTEPYVQGIDFQRDTFVNSKETKGLAVIDVINLTNEVIYLEKGEMVCAAVISKYATTELEEEEEKANEPKVEKICALTGTPDTNYDRVISMIKKKEMYSDDIEEELAGTDPENLGRGPKTRVDEVIRKHRVKAATHRMALGKIKKNVYLHEAYPLQSMPSTKRL